MGMKVSEVYGGDIIVAADFESGQEVVATIGRVGIFVDQAKGNKIRLGFSDNEKDLVLNKTNANVLSEKLGDDTDDWIGGKIKMAAVEVLYMGKKVPGVSVVAAKPASMESKPGKGKKSGKEPPAEASARSEQDIPF
jgi:hypothetical protein